MDDLVKWLSEQLDEDERVARSASPGSWSAGDVVDGEMMYQYGNYGWYVSGPVGSPELEDSEQGKADVVHIAHWHPARVLAEVEAKRVILTYIRVALSDRAAEYVVQTLALPYRERPGYRPEWAPDR